MDSTHDLFERISDGGEPFLEQVRQEGWAETLSLDFKQAGNERGELTRDDRRNLAEALSGFANSDGGIIVWGVDCRKDEDSVDVASELRPIANIKRFISDLENATPQLAAPGVIGVEHRALLKRDDFGAGYAVTYIPKGTGLPHMAIAKDQHRYYYRSGASFLKMEAFMLADRFGRRPQPKLSLSLYSQNGGELRSADTWTRQYKFLAGVKNVGPSVALYPALRLMPKWPLHFSEFGLDGNGRLGLPRRPSGTNTAWQFFVGGMNDVVHPGVTLEVTAMEYTYPLQSAPNDCGHIEVDYELYCDGFYEAGTRMISVDNDLLLFMKRDF